MSRVDGRTELSLRPLTLSQSLLSRADGSAQFSFGNLSVLASVTGPTEVRIREELVDCATLEINVRPLRGQTGPASKSAESSLQSLLSPIILLSLHPRSLIQLTVQTLSSPSTAFSHPLSTDPADALNARTTAGQVEAPPCGIGAGAAERAAMINAAMLALVDAGVECRGMVLAVAVAFVPAERGGEGEGTLLLDPTPAEEAAARSTHVFAFSFGVGVGGTEGECVGVDSVGQFAESELFEAQDTALLAAQGVMAFVRKSIESRYGVGGEKAVKKEQQDKTRVVEDAEMETGA